MKVKCYMAYHRNDTNPLVAIDTECIDESSAHAVDVSREEFEARVIELATDAAQDMLMVKLTDDRRILGLVGHNTVFCYEFESELAAELIFQLFNTSRREWRKTQDAPF